MLTVIKKELLATAWVVALGAAMFGWFALEFCGVIRTLGMLISIPNTLTTPGSFSLTDPRLLFWWGCLSAAFAGGLGLVMSLNDAMRGMWAFVLAQPISRRRYFVAKLITGSVLSVAMMGMPAAVILVWSSIPGNIPMPFDWSFTQPVVESCGWAVVVFLGGFLSGIRPASWWWSKLWPLGATLMLGLWFWLFSTAGENQLPHVLVPTAAQYWGLCVVISAMLVVTILHVIEERDFA